MMYPRASLFFIVLLFIFSCRKEENIAGENQPSALFTIEGANFSWYQLNSTIWPLVSLSIPPNSVSQKHNIEYYTFIIDASNPLDSFSLNFGINDVNFFRSTSDSLLSNATLSIPFPSSITYNTSFGYVPYKIKTNGTTNLWGQLNIPQNWTEITNFTWDNTSKTITFEINDLNASYVIARHL